MTKKLIFAVTEDWYFYSHRKPMIKAAQEEGFDVSVITNIDKHEQAIKSLGVNVIPFSFERRSLNPFKALSQITALYKIYKKEKPDIVHHIAMKPIVFGSLAAISAGVPKIVNAFAGLGFIFNSRKPLARTLRIALWPLFFFILRFKNTHTLLQNNDDRLTLSRAALIGKKRVHIIRGSGVDLDEYMVSDINAAPSSEFICVYAGRMISIKGIKTLKEAFEILEEKAPHIKLHLYGKPDLENPGSWSLSALNEWAENSDNVAYKGQSDNMSLVWNEAQLAIQASYGGEGVPKSLLEAAACARPIVATDVPGCREVVSEGENGYLVPPYDAKALAKAIENIASDISRAQIMGNKSREIVETDLSAQAVTNSTRALYKSL